MTTALQSKADKEHLACHALFAMNRSEIPYCLWKSFDRFAEGVEGITDLDVLVDSGKKQAVFDLLLKLGWYRLLPEPWRQFPHVYDFFQYDPQHERFIHLHIHFQLVMGEKLVKSLSLPLESLYLETAEKINDIYHVHAELEFTVFIIRLSLKIRGWDYARVLRRMSRKAIYRDLFIEYKNARERCDRKKLSRLLDHPSLEFIDGQIILKAFDDIYKLKWFDRWKIKRQVVPYRRKNALQRLIAHAVRSFQKKQIGNGKCLPARGVSIAICGADGSGKTTVVNSLALRLSRHFAVAHFYMGGNKGSKGIERWLYTHLFWWPYLVVRKIFKIIKFKKVANSIENAYYGFEQYLIAREKMSRIDAGTKKELQGAVVLYERFPIFAAVGGDGGGAAKNSYCKSLEEKYYKKIKHPNFIVILRVNPELAIQRKPDHNPDVIANKTDNFDKYISANENDSRFIVIDASQPIKTIINVILQRLNLELQRDN